MSVYYNDSEPFVCDWLENLIRAKLLPDGVVDRRRIEEVRPEDVQGFTQCHFFAGIGGWAYALQLSGWGDRPVWTGSCPCQPLSGAGQQRAHADQRHLWPAFYRLISECRPSAVFGEQVASKLGREWLAGVRADLEGLGYACGAADLCAASVGAPHQRQRLWWVADAHGDGAVVEGRDRDDAQRHPAAALQERQNIFARPDTAGTYAGDLADTDSESPRRVAVTWSECHQWLAEPSVGRVAHGIPARVGRLRAYGNAIVPEVAAAFVSAYLALGGTEGHAP